MGSALCGEMLSRSKTMASGASKSPDPITTSQETGLLQIHAFVLAPPALEALGADVVLATDLLSPMPVSASLSIRIICSVVRIVFSSMMSFR